MNKKIVVRILIIFCFLAVSAYAKDKKESQKPLTAADIVAKMKVQLDLTDQQVQKVQAIIENYLALELQLKLEEKKGLKYYYDKLTQAKGKEPGKGGSQALNDMLQNRQDGFPSGLSW